MSESKINNSFFKKIQNFTYTNYIKLIILILILLILFFGLQLYNYSKLQKIKNSSIIFFDAINEKQDDYSNLENLVNDENIFSILSKLKLIQKNIDINNFGTVKDLYKEIIFSSNLDPLYKSAISANAAYTFINASYYKKSDIYLDDILIYIDNISNDLESYYSIKKELEYLLIILEIDLNKSEYKNNTIALDKYNEIFNSSLVSTSIKERVQKIHEFQLYK